MDITVDVAWILQLGVAAMVYLRIPPVLYKVPKDYDPR